MRALTVFSLLSDFQIIQTIMEITMEVATKKQQALSLLAEDRPIRVQPD